jgi:hypothetical protein
MCGDAILGFLEQARDLLRQLAQLIPQFVLVRVLLDLLCWAG